MVGISPTEGQLVRIERYVDVDKIPETVPSTKREGGSPVKKNRLAISSPAIFHVLLVISKSFENRGTKRQRKMTEKERESEGER